MIPYNSIKQWFRKAYTDLGYPDDKVESLVDEGVKFALWRQERPKAEPFPRVLGGAFAFRVSHVWA